MGREFECICDSLPEETNINTTSTNENVPEIEHKSRVIKGTNSHFPVQEDYISNYHWNNLVCGDLA